MGTEPDLTKPITREEVEKTILWDRFPYNLVPDEQRLAVLTYHRAIIGIEDCFDSFDGDSIRNEAEYAVDAQPGRTLRGQADRIVTAYFLMLDKWHDALDALDSELRGDTVAGSLPEWADELVKRQALGLFSATTTLLRAVAQYHHGNCGPELSEDHGHAYVLSNSIVNPFA